MDLHFKRQGLGEKVIQVVYNLDKTRIVYKYTGFGSLFAFLKGPIEGNVYLAQLRKEPNVFSSFLACASRK